MSALLPLLVVAGPTGSGKTALAITLAEELGGEVISCDSVAVYRLLDIGSAKPDIRERARVPHHCLDLYWPNEFCTAGDYARHARTAIANVSARGKLPVIAGGTGLYLRALLHGLSAAPPRDEKLRSRLHAREASRGAGYLHRLLTKLDPTAAFAIHPNDTPKIIRSIEVTIAMRQPQSEQWKTGRDALEGYRVFQVGLNPSRDALYDRLNRRASAMFAEGLVEETDAVRTRFGEACAPLASLGYAQALSLLKGQTSLDDAISAAQQGHRNYAKRQLTWFRRDSTVRWWNGFGSEQLIQESILQNARDHVAKTQNGAAA